VSQWIFLPTNIFLYRLDLSLANINYFLSFFILYTHALYQSQLTTGCCSSWHSSLQSSKCQECCLHVGALCARYCAARGKEVIGRQTVTANGNCTSTWSKALTYYLSILRLLQRWPSSGLASIHAANSVSSGEVQ
jgi:hypothetical protein